jgi:hypothetical protein
MAHPARKQLVGSLLDQFKPMPIGVAWDQKNNIWDTCSRAWLLFDKKADWHLVIQDDVILCKDFITKVNELIKNHSGHNNIFSLYLGNRNKFRKDVNRLRPNGGIVVKKNIHHEIALIFPTKKIIEMLNYCDSLNPTDDKVINRYVTHKNLDVIIPLPNLINHRNNIASLHTLNKSTMAIRKSIWFADGN